MPYFQVLFDLISTATYEFHKDYWSEISAPAKDLITKLLVIDPEKRMTVRFISGRIERFASPMKVSA